MEQHGNLSAVLRLARVTGARPIPAYVERQTGARFHTTFGPPVELIRGEDEKAVLLANLRNADELLESIIVPRLDQWWMLGRTMDNPNLAAEIARDPAGVHASAAAPVPHQAHEMR
jgi:hypothetical protein